MRASIRSLLFAFAFVSLSLSAARATTVMPMAMEEQVLRADLVAIVECTTAGGIVAKYRLVSVYKGDVKPGEVVSIRTPPDYWEPQFPIALVGERFVVAAYRGEAPSNVMSFTTGSPVPLWWRSLPADFTLPLFQGVSPLPEQPQGAEMSILGSKFTELDAFGARVRELNALPAAEKDLLVLKSILRASRPGTAAEDAAARKVLWEKAEATTSPEALIAVFRNTTDIPNLGGMAEWLESKRLGREAARRAQPTERSALAELSAAEVEKYKAALAKVESGDFGPAVERLTEKRPEVMAHILLRWKRPDARWETVNLPALLGAYFAWRCPPEHRKMLLPKLADADEPAIRVAAAIYWALDEEKAGTVKLAELMKLPGDPGAWAALALASRGNKEALDRAVHLLEEPSDESGMQAVQHRNLQKRLVVLLSNSATASHVPQPPRTITVDGIYKEASAWYLEHRAALTPHDPWFAELANRRVD